MLELLCIVGAKVVVFLTDTQGDKEIVDYFLSLQSPDFKKLERFALPDDERVILQLLSWPNYKYSTARDWEGVASCLDRLIVTWSNEEKAWEALKIAKKQLRLRSHLPTLLRFARVITQNLRDLRRKFTIQFSEMWLRLSSYTHWIVMLTESADRGDAKVLEALEGVNAARNSVEAAILNGLALMAPLNCQKSINRALPHLLHCSNNIAEAAFKLLACVGTELDLVPKLLDALRDSRLHVRIRSLKMLFTIAQRGNRELVESMTATLESHPHERRLKIRVLGKVATTEDAEVIAKLKLYLDHPSWSVKRTTVEAIRTIGYMDEQLKSKFEELRRVFRFMFSHSEGTVYLFLAASARVGTRELRRLRD